MKIPGFRDRTTTAYDPATGATVGATDTVRTAPVGGHPLNAVTAAHPLNTASTTGAAATDGVISARDLQREQKLSYDRGREDQRRAQRSNPILTIVVVLFALLGVTLAVLAATRGGFEGAGQIVDGWLGLASEEAREATVQARDAAGEAAQDAGAAIQGAGASVEADAEAARN